MPGLTKPYKGLHVGAENELGGTCLMLWDADQSAFVEPPYGEYIAKTEPGDFDVPKMGLQPDGVSKVTNTAKIEHVGGARLTTDVGYEAKLNSACKLLIETLMAGSTFATASKMTIGQIEVTPLWKVLEIYNKKLLAKGAAYKQFKLLAVPSPPRIWFVRPSPRVVPVPQLNFEVPLRNVGHIPVGKQEQKSGSDFANAFVEPKHKAAYLACREKANALVERNFVNIARAYYANRQKHYDSIKLAKLRSLFTLYYYIRAVEQTKGEGKVQKDSYELLPKVGVNDMIRNGLNDRDREVLVAVTGNAGQRPRLPNCNPQPITFLQLKNQMNQDILACAKILRTEISKLHDNIDSIHDAVLLPRRGHLRYREETADGYGNGIKWATAPKPLDDESRYHQLHWRPDTPTFKPQQVIDYSYDKGNGTAGREPVMLFETRHQNHPFSEAGILVDALREGNNRDRIEAAHKNTMKQIENVQKPFPNRQAKH